MKRRQRVALITSSLVMAFAASAASASADTCTWTAAEADWTVATDWSCGHVPGPADDVLIGDFSHPDVSIADASARSITEHGITSDLQIDPGRTLTVSSSEASSYFGGHLSVKGTLTLDEPTAWAWLDDEGLDDGTINVNSTLSLLPTQARDSGGYPPGAPQMDGSGTIRITTNGSMTSDPGAGQTATLVPHLDNDGTGAGGGVEVKSGTLDLSIHGDAGSTTGPYAIDDRATLLLDSGATLESPSIAGAGTLDLSGSTITVGPTDTFSPTTLQLAAGGTLTLNNDASITNLIPQNGGIRDGTGTLTVTGSADFSSGGLNLKGGTTTIASTASPVSFSGMQLTLSNATLNLNTAATWTDNQWSLLSGATVNVNSSLAISNGGTLGNLGGGNSVLNVGSGGSLTIDPGSRDFDIAPRLQNAGTLETKSGNTFADGGFSQSAGTTTVDAGTHLNVNGVVGLNGGVLNGNGTLGGPVDNTGGTVAPGTSPGKLTITGDYTQGSGGTLAEEITGTTPDTQFDQLQVGGALNLDGQLAINSLTFVPSSSDTFKIISGPSSRTGAFASVTGATIYGATYSPQYDTTDNGVTLTVTGGDVVITNCNDPGLAQLTTIHGNLIANNLPGCTSLSMPKLQSASDVSMTGDPSLANANLGLLNTTSGNINITGNNSATVVNLESLTTASGNVALETADSNVHLVGATVGGDFTVVANGSDSVSAQTGGGTTDIRVLGGTAAMHVVLPRGAFDHPVAFTITRTGNTPPESGTGANGNPATVDPIAGYQFAFAVPTLNHNAQLTFTVDLSSLDAATRTALVNGVQDGSATVAVKGDAQGSSYQALAHCASGQTPEANGCVTAVLLDRNGQVTQDPSAAVAARFDGVAGHFSSYAVALVTSAADTTPPAVTIKLTSPNNGTPDGQNGWFVTGPVKGTVTADDTNSGGSNISKLDCGSLTLNTSGLGTPTASGTFSIATDGITHLSCTATDSGGNTSSPVTKDVELDTAKPSLAPSIAPTPILLHGSATANPNATDATSGVASQSCDPVDTSTAGVHTLTCRATDKAGNTNSGTVNYLVQYKILGFFTPAPNSKWKQGQTVPIKIALADANGVRISDTEAQGLLSPTCRVTFTATGAQSTSACTKYETTNHQFVYNWKLGSKTGNDTITITVSYPGSQTTTTLSEPIVITS